MSKKGFKVGDQVRTTKELKKVIDEYFSGVITKINGNQITFTGHKTSIHEYWLEPVNNSNEDISKEEQEVLQFGGVLVFNTDKVLEDA